MSFTTLPFLVLVALSVAAYYLLPQRVQWMALLAASMVFYCVGGGKTVLYVFYTAVIVYGSGLLLGRFNDLRRAAPKEEKKAITARYKPYRRAVVLVACLANFGLLYVLKYWNFTADLFQPLADQLRPGTQIPLSELVLPLGISFFMFQSVGYVIDVYRDKYAPEKNFAKLLLFVSFFPQMVQGPISRFNDLAPQLFARRSLDYTDLKYGIQLILWGYFKKMVIADRAAVLVNTVLDDPWSYSGSILAVGVLFYCIQLYGDFSGGIDITRGVARLFGIDLAENFRRPLFSTSLTDFWRRWHITLGAWLRDFLYIPLGGNRHGKLKQYRNLFLTMLIGGAWHGAGWTFIIWGALHGAMLSVNHFFRARIKGRPLERIMASPPLRVCCIAVTFFCLNFCWVIFRAVSLEGAGRVYTAMFRGPFTRAAAGLDPDLTGLTGLAAVTARWLPNNYFQGWLPLVMLLLCFVLVWAFPNSGEMLHGRRDGSLPRPAWRPSAGWAAGLAVLAFAALILVSRKATFLYFQF